MPAEHTHAILPELDYTTEEISVLRQKGVVAGS